MGTGRPRPVRPPAARRLQGRAGGGVVTDGRYCAGCGADVVGRGRLACTCPGGPTRRSNGVEPSPLPARPWPELAESALYGLPGRIVSTILPHTEADAAAMLATLYAAAGVMIGDKPHVVAGGAWH